MTPLNDAGTLLISFFFGFVVLLFLGRVLLQLCQVNFYHQVPQFIATLTNPVTMPLARVIPRTRRFDSPAALVALVAKWLEIMLLGALAGASLNGFGVIALALAELLHFTVNVFFWAILIQIVLSWLNPQGGDPLSPTLRQLTAPILAPLKQVIPPIGMFDLSPMVAMLGLMLTKILVTQPLIQATAQLGFP